MNDLPPSSGDESFQTLWESPACRLERIVSRGHASPSDFWYDQELDEWVVVLSGEARLRFEGDAEPIHLQAGDYLNIAAHRRHRVEWTSPNEPTVWLAMHYPGQSPSG